MWRHIRWSPPISSHHSLIDMDIFDIWYFIHDEIFSSQETWRNTVGPQSSSAPLERASRGPTWFCPWMCPRWATGCWKWRPHRPRSPHCTRTTAPPQWQRAAASDTTSQSSSAQRSRGRGCVCRSPLRTPSWETQSSDVHPIWSPSGREISPTRTVAGKNTVLESSALVTCFFLSFFVYTIFCTGIHVIIILIADD